MEGDFDGTEEDDGHWVDPAASKPGGLPSESLTSASTAYKKTHDRKLSSTLIFKEATTQTDLQIPLDLCIPEGFDVGAALERALLDWTSGDSV